MKFMFFRKEEIIMAEPFVPLTIVETGLLSGTTGVVFVLTGPTLAALLGAHLAFGNGFQGVFNKKLDFFFS